MAFDLTQRFDPFGGHTSKDTGMSFQAWLDKINQHIVSVVGMTRDHIPDWDYWSAWDDGLTPCETAYAAMREGGMIS